MSQDILHLLDVGSELFDVLRSFENILAVEMTELDLGNIIRLDFINSEADHQIRNDLALLLGRADYLDSLVDIKENFLQALEQMKLILCLAQVKINSALDALGSFIVGIVSGIIVVLIVELLDLKLHIDDPVGAVAVHLGNGIWGTIAVGLFANPDAPAGLTGLFYGAGGAYQLGIQVLGILAIIAWTSVCITITYTIIEKTIGLRASREDELAGLDISEHGLPSAYADFAPSVQS